MFSLPEPYHRYRVEWVDRIREEGFLDSWDSKSPQAHGPLTSGYLAALENAHPSDLTFRYGLLFTEGQSEPVARIALQILNFSHRNFKFPEMNWRTLLASLLLRVRRFRVIMAGNLFSVGKPLLECPDVRHLPALLKATTLEAERLGFDLLLLKDLPEAWPEAEFQTHGFQPFEADLTMQLDVQSAWKSYDDYVNALSKKYRQRAARVRAAGDPLLRRWIPADAIESQSEEINTLFRAVQDKQVVRMGVIDWHYFRELARTLGSRFRLLGYYLDERLIGFASYIDHGDELEVHYIGMDYRINASHQLYFNILLDGIARAITEGYSKLELGRTAREAKAICGCEPRLFRDRYMTRKPWVQRLLDRMASSFTEGEGQGWKNRHPFKKREG